MMISQYTVVEYLSTVTDPNLRQSLTVGGGNRATLLNYLPTVLGHQRHKRHILPTDYTQPKRL